MRRSLSRAPTRRPWRRTGSRPRASQTSGGCGIAERPSEAQAGPARRVDRVALTGAVVAVAGGFALPFVQLRPNRIASGMPEGIGSAGWLGWLLVVVCLAACAASALSSRIGRRWLVLPFGVGVVALLPWTLGAASVALGRGQPEIARVSVGSGAWVILSGGAVVWFAGSRRARLAAGGTVALAAVALSLALAIRFGGLGDLSLSREYVAQSSRFWQLLREHLVLSGLGVGCGLLIGVPLGVLASRNAIVGNVTLGAVGIIQTVPSLALLGLLVFPLVAVGLPGIGTLPAIVALTLYALLPIVRNTYVGLDGVDPGALDAGRGMGMSRAQSLLRVEAPLALPFLLEGLRSAAALVIGIAAVTAFVGAGGLGILVFQGWGQQADDLTLLGALPMVVLAVAVDVGVRALAALVVSPGIRESAE